VTATDLHPTIDVVWRMESPRLIVSLTKIVRDRGFAEDLAQDALVAALEQWPVCRRIRARGSWPRRKIAPSTTSAETLAWNGKHEELGREFAEREIAVPDFDSALDDNIGDDLLRLVFTACHPVLPAEGRVALTLRLLGGLTTAEIARAFLVPEAAIAQRIVRSKRTIAEKQIPYEVPRGAEPEKRLSSVLEVIYLIFNEGYSASAGDD
jgi:RNA polymerase sigma-70 factor (ECF subfamily)